MCSANNKWNGMYYNNKFFLSCHANNRSISSASIDECVMLITSIRYAIHKKPMNASSKRSVYIANKKDQCVVIVIDHCVI